MAPALLDEPGMGVLMAAQILVSWSHPGRCRDEAAFARLGGVAPLEATSGQTQTRYRLSRGGDRQLNRALHTVIGAGEASPADQGLHRPPDQRRQDQERGDALPQALLRAPPLPAS